MPMPLGGIITLVVLLPNLLMLFLPPVGNPPRPEKKDRLLKIMEGIERAGQAGSFIIPFFYRLPALREASVDALVVMALAMVIYYVAWARYALKGHRFVLLYAPFFGVPLPMAISPVVYFAAAAIFLGSMPLVIAAGLLATGHLYVSYSEWKRCQNTMFLQTG
jgi:hypothetical protein